MTYNPTTLTEEVLQLVAVSGTGAMLVEALQKGAVLVLLLPPKEKIAALVRSAPPADAVKVVALFHIVSEADFDEIRMKCSDSFPEAQINTVSGYPLTIVCADAMRKATLEPNVLELSDVSSTPVRVPVGDAGLSIKVYRIASVLMPKPGSQMVDGPADCNGITVCSGGAFEANEFSAAGAKLKYVGPVTKIENDDFVKDKVGFGMFALESIRLVLLAAARVAHKSSDYDENMLNFAKARSNAVASLVTQYHLGNFSKYVADFIDSVSKAWVYLKKKDRVGEKIKLSLGGTQKTALAYKTALITAGFGKKKLIGKSTEIAPELEPIVALLDALAVSPGGIVFSNFFVGFAYMLENDWKEANNWFDDAAENGHKWINAEWKSL